MYSRRTFGFWRGSEKPPAGEMPDITNHSVKCVLSYVLSGDDLLARVTNHLMSMEHKTKKTILTENSIAMIFVEYKKDMENDM